MGRGRGGREKGLSEIPEFREEGGEEPVYRDRMDLGPTITDPAVTALMATRETVSGGVAINLAGAGGRSGGSTDFGQWGET